MTNKPLTPYPFALIIIGLSLVLAAGLGLGYLIFRPSSAAMAESDSGHVHDADATTWTCSMHPQIQREERGSCPICGMDLIPLASQASKDPLVLEMTNEAVKLAQIETTVIAESQTGENVLQMAGKIQADERLAASQVAHIPGRIEQLYVSFEGETVRRGQKVARLYSPELITAQQEMIQARKLADRNPGLLAAATRKLAHWKLTEAQIQAIAASDTIQETFDIYADASGVVTTRRVSVGDYLRQGEVLFDLVNLSRVWVLFDAYERDLAHLRVGDKLRFTTPSVPGKTFDTRITFIDPVIDPQTRIASIRGEVANAQGALKPEMFVRGEWLSPAAKQAELLVPKSAVLWTGKRSVVYVKMPDRQIPSFRYQSVVLGERIGQDYRIAGGLQAGDEVVTNGSFSIDAAAQLNHQQSMMNQWVRSQEDAPSAVPGDSTFAPQAFQQQLGAVVRAYLPLKDALVQSNSSSARSLAKALLSQVNNADMTLLSGERHDFWMTQASAITTHTEKIAASESLSEQRHQLSFLSTALIATIRRLGISGETLFVQHCPMAMDNQGGDWLSLQREIRNPYFGEDMLTCGSVSETIPPGGPSRPSTDPY
jgi:Cu(I)/Ag(I) efflux system membrane fusion protein